MDILKKVKEIEKDINKNTSSKNNNIKKIKEKNYGNNFKKF